MSVAESQKLRGRMQFADSQIFGRLGKLCMKAITITQHAFPYKGDMLSEHTKKAMQRFVLFLEHAEPRQLKLSSGLVWKIFTDACYEPHRDAFVCGLGGVLVDPMGQCMEFFSVELTKQQRTLLGEDVKRTIIFEAELLALVLAFSLWRDRIKASALVCFVDNNSARDVAISGIARNDVASCLIDFLLKLQMATNFGPWYAKVPTPSNIADEPSRGDIVLMSELGVKCTDIFKVFSDIFKVFSEIAVMMGNVDDG